MNMKTTETKDKTQRLLMLCDVKLRHYPTMQKVILEDRPSEILLRPDFEYFAIKSIFIDYDLSMAKLCFYRYGVLCEQAISKYNERSLEYGMDQFGNVLLSDCQELIMRYANLTNSSFEIMTSRGHSTPIYIMQCILKEDWNEFERAMVIMKTKTVPRHKLELDALFFEALAERNKEKAEAVIGEFLTPKQHKRRNKLKVILNEFISHPAIGYTKLAWIKGLKVEVDHPFIPKELLPVQPLPNYDIPPYYPGIS
jgi:hypothetical protein